MTPHAPKTALLVAVLLVHFSGSAQEKEEPVVPEHARHEVSLLIAHTGVSQGVNVNGERGWLMLPSWGLNYNYWLSERWAIGLHTDLITETFVVKENHNEAKGEPEVERTRPIAPAIMASFRPHHHWAFTLGAGAEFAQEGDLFLMRAGTEYTIHLGGPWETSGSFAYDLRSNAYDSYTLGIGITRTFR
jgi:hypothetical protein